MVEVLEIGPFLIIQDEVTSEEVEVARYYQILTGRVSWILTDAQLSKSIGIVQQGIMIQHRQRLVRETFYRIVVCSNNSVSNAVHRMVLSVPIRAEVFLYRLRRLVLRPKPRDLGPELMILHLIVDRIRKCRVRHAFEIVLCKSSVPPAIQLNLADSLPKNLSSDYMAIQPQLSGVASRCNILVDSIGQPRRNYDRQRFWPTVFTVDFVNCALNRRTLPLPEVYNNLDCVTTYPTIQHHATEAIIEKLSAIERSSQHPEPQPIREVMSNVDINRTTTTKKKAAPQKQYTFDKPSLSSLLKQRPVVAITANGRKSKLPMLKGISTKSDRGHSRLEKCQIPLSPTSLKRIRQSYSITCEKGAKDTAEIKLSVTVRDAELLLQPKKLSSFAKSSHKRTVSEPTEEQKEQTLEDKRRSEYIGNNRTIKEDACQSCSIADVEDQERYRERLRKQFAQEVSERFMRLRLHGNDNQKLLAASKIAIAITKRVLEQRKGQSVATLLSNLVRKTLNTVWSCLKDNSSSVRRLDTEDSNHLEDRINTLSRHQQLLDQLEENEQMVSLLTNELEEKEQQICQTTNFFNSLKLSARRAATLLLVRAIGQAARKNLRESFKAM